MNIENCNVSFNR